MSLEYYVVYRGDKTPPLWEVVKAEESAVFADNDKTGPYELDDALDAMTNINQLIIKINTKGVIWAMATAIGAIGCKVFNMTEDGKTLGVRMPNGNGLTIHVTEHKGATHDEDICPA